MARNPLATYDALDRAIATNQALDALVCLLASAREADMPTGHSLAELLGSLHRSFATHLSDAQDGLRSPK